MPQFPTSVNPVIMSSAKGINDITEPVKLDPGFTPFSVNLSAGGDTWVRRQGRDFFYLSDGSLATMFYLTTWNDGSSNIIAALGGSLYTFIPFTYVVDSSKRLIIQSADLRYWNVTPSASTGLIFPTGVTTPSTASRNSDLLLDSTQSIAFKGNSGFTQLAVDQSGGWFLQGGNGDFGLTLFTTDLVFSIASGASLKMVDAQGNTWQYSMTNDGDLIVTTI